MATAIVSGSERGLKRLQTILARANSIPWASGLLLHPARRQWLSLARPGFRHAGFSDMIVYQLHIGTFAIRKPGVTSNFSMLASNPLSRSQHQCPALPVDEQEANPNMGYSGADLFRPTSPISRSKVAVLSQKSSMSSTRRNQCPLALADIQSGPGQLKALVDPATSTASPSSSTWSTITPAASRSMGGSTTITCTRWIAASIGNNDGLYFTVDAAPAASPSRCGMTMSRNFSPAVRYYLEEMHADGFRYDESRR
jgi:1,4-alpha-glucan branching enzyme